MKINIVEKYTVIVIEIKGDMIDGRKLDEFKAEIKKLISEGKLNVVVDLAEVLHVNSSGLGMLISGYTSLKNAGGNLKLANVTDKIESLMAVTKLITIFENYSSLEEAINSYN